MKPKPFTSKTTSYGRNNEIKARNLYVQTAGHHVHDCGFVVNPRYPFIGATPDAKICENGVTGIMEIKCPFSQRDNLITDAMHGADFCLELSENGPRLKINHDYFIQAEGQLLVTGSQFCDFVVYTKKDIHIERIYPDKAGETPYDLAAKEKLRQYKDVMKYLKGKIPYDLAAAAYRGPHKEVMEYLQEDNTSLGLSDYCL
ncbi:Hypothetical predicted protein [Mytilus galloprovincialis]|uniref:YqaJ viral recombinase domain-containing protein n=1 Tax=Mytilus galloprovincialis TaxID=29158 RepID=A0A8B6EN45_MYTGA|nr:Hypothetical predicted protein [Mytilus galloprovincialis]